MYSFKESKMRAKVVSLLVSLALIVSFLGTALPAAPVSAAAADT
jgi:hypothetical protein